MTTITPTPFAEAINSQLVEVLRAIHDHYIDQVAPALSAMIDHHDFGPARQLIADVEHIVTAGDLVVVGNLRPSDILGDLMYELVNTSKIGEVLDDIDPERLANEEQQITRLRDGGHWSDEEEALWQAEKAASDAKYPQVQR